MAFDGFVVSALGSELREKLIGGRITKISQPEKDEIILTIKNYDTYKLDISAEASLPLIYLTEETKPSPLTAPGFLMLLRKHLNSARILDIIQPEMERVLQIKIEHLNEMGDLQIKYLIVELMGKHSNIIFADDEFNIIDSIKHISSLVSSVREVLPGRKYFIPKTTDKTDFHTETEDSFISKIKAKNSDIVKAVYTTFTGFSPAITVEFLSKAFISPDAYTEELSDNDLSALYEIIYLYITKADKGDFSPTILFKADTPVDFAAFKQDSFTSAEYHTEAYESISKLISEYYSLKDKVVRINQKSATLKKAITNAIERASKKYDLQLQQLKSTEKRDKFRIYGELITTYGYQTPEGSKSLTCINYYDNEEITIPLDETLPVMANAKKYFDRYAKLKRTYEAVSEQIIATEEELYHLRSIKNSLDIALYENDLTQIRNELQDFGYVKKVKPMKGKKEKKEKITSKPLHYKTPEGFDIYVGKNNYQNDELTFKFANGGDWWFHAKKMPGSHVIVKSNEELPDAVFEYAAKCAAYYSSDKSGGKIEIDYLKRKDVKKPNGAVPGYVVYYTNYSMVVDADISALTLVE